jgi:hypothetical protein
MLLKEEEWHRERRQEEGCQDSSTQVLSMREEAAPL